MAEVLLSLGSSINREYNLGGALAQLRDLFGEIEISPIYESEAVGFEGDHFYNFVAAINTNTAVGELSKTLKNIEDKFGRDRSSPKFSARTLDIDILTYHSLTGVVDGVQLPRDEILKNAFVLLPLANLRPNSYYPGTTNTYKQLWEQSPARKQALWAVDKNF